MRLIRGVEAGLAELTRTPGYEEPTLPSSVIEHTTKVFGRTLSASEAVEQIVSEVRADGDSAVRKYSQLFDNASLEHIEIDSSACNAALQSLEPLLRESLEVAATRIRSYHESAMPSPWSNHNAGYSVRHIPIERVGLYVPGGTAAYPSTVLMTAIPAKVAGVTEVILCTPYPSPPTLAAAAIAGVDRVFAVGGAQAIASMAFGTESIPRVDKICGPGNVFVSIAKRLVYGHVDIDGLYGPTETMLIADQSVNPKVIASDLLAQAEHDELASPVLLTDSETLAIAVEAEVAKQLPSLERQTIARAAMDRQGVAVVVDSIEQAIEIANAFAPEHLCLLVQEPEPYLPLVRNAGGIFLGENSPEVMGDYVAGPSHTMPTGATARFASSLGVHTFLKHVPVVSLSLATLREVGPHAVSIAYAEGLSAHARAAQIRLEGDGFGQSFTDEQAL